MEGWFAYLTEIGIPEENPAWAKTAPTSELPESLEPYSPMIFPGFNEEEYMNQLAMEDDEEALTNETAKPIREVIVEEAGKTTTEGAGEVATQDPPLEL